MNIAPATNEPSKPKTHSLIIPDFCGLALLAALKASFASFSPAISFFYCSIFTTASARAAFTSFLSRLRAQTVSRRSMSRVAMNGVYRCFVPTHEIAPSMLQSVTILEI